MFRSVAFAAFPPFLVGDRIYETGGFSLEISEQAAGMESRREAGNEKSLFILFDCNFMSAPPAPDHHALNRQ